MIVYHGSSQEVQKPNLLHGRVDTDFGLGFYLTEDRKMAEKWAVGKNTSVINKYDLNLEGLNVIRLGLSKQWLEFVTSNRGFSDKTFNIDGVDVIIGPTADDKMFITISNYMSGFITSEQAIKYLNVANYSDQIVLKTDKALNQISFLESKEIKGFQKINLLQQVSYDKKMANLMLQELLEKDKQSSKINERLVSDENYDQEGER